MEVRVTSSLDSSRWHAIFTLLSLDSAGPYLPEIGLNLFNLAAIRLIARQYLEEEEAAEPIAPLEAYMNQATALLMRALARIAQITNQETAESLYRWGIEEFIYGDREEGDSYMWGHLLSRLAGVYEESIDSPSLPAEKTDAIKSTVREQLGDSYRQLREEIDELAEQDKSAWDEKLHQAYQADHPEIPDALGPLIRLAGYLKDRRLRAVWRNIKSLLTGKELEAFIQWAKAETHKKRTSDLRSPPGGW